MRKHVRRAHQAACFELTVDCGGFRTWILQRSGNAETQVTVVYTGVMVGNLCSGPLGAHLGRREMVIASYIGNSAQHENAREG